MRKAILIVAGLVAVLAGAVLIVPRVIDWNAYKPNIAQAVRDATGREFHIDGQLDIKLIPGAEFSAAGVRLSNVAGAKTPEMVKIAGIEGKIALLPLIGGTLVVERLIVREPDVNLEIDATGRPNWDMRPAKPGTAPPDKAPGMGKKSPIADIKLGDVRVERGQFTYSDAVSGQNLVGRDLNVAISMPELSRPLAAKIALTLNAEPTTLDIAVDTPQAVMAGRPATIVAALESKHIRMRLDGKAAEGGGTGFAGIFDLDMPSVGQLARWLGRPLEPGQADPGRLKLHAEFDAAQSGANLKTLTIEGAGVQATASGAVAMANGDPSKVAFKLDGGVLDVDRYLPKPVARATTPGQPAPSAGKPAPARAAGDPLAMLSDAKFDLKPFRNKEIDVRINLQGIKALGYDIGRVDMAALMSGGKLDATVREIQLYNGKIVGQTKLDASGDALGIEANLAVDKVNVGALARAAMAGGEPPVTGAATMTLTAKGLGASPRALAEALIANLEIDLSGADMRNAAVKLSALKVAVALSGIDKPPTVKASAVYNGQPVTLDVTGDTTRKLLTADSFQLTAAMASPLIKADYAGAVLRRPTPGLDGKFELAVGSLGRLMSWVGTPLGAGQPDPGPLNIHAVMSGDGGKATLKEARIEGKAIRATAKGSFDATKSVPEFEALVNVEQVDLNAYLPPEAKAPAKATAPAPKSAGWSEEPIDVAFLSAAKGKVEFKFAAVRYRDLVIESGQVEAALSERALKTSLREVKLAKGSIDGAATLTALDNGLALDYQARIFGLQAEPLLVAFAGSDRLSGTAEFTAKGRATGRSQKDLIGTLDGDGSFKFLDGAINGINLAATLRQAKTLGFDASARDVQKTDFAELSGTFTIRDGVLENKDLKLLAPLLRLTGNGQVPMPPRTIAYGLTATLVGTTQGQGGKDGITGLAIPVRVTGSWDAPAYNVDWQAVFLDAAKDPERLKSMPKDLLQAAKGVGVSLPGLPDTGKLPDTGLLPDVGKTLRNLLGR